MTTISTVHKAMVIAAALIAPITSAQSQDRSEDRVQVLLAALPRVVLEVREGENGGTVLEPRIRCLRRDRTCAAKWSGHFDAGTIGALRQRYELRLADPTIPDSVRSLAVGEISVAFDEPQFTDSGAWVRVMTTESLADDHSVLKITRIVLTRSNNAWVVSRVIPELIT